MINKRNKCKKWISVFLAAVMLTGAIPCNEISVAAGSNTFVGVDENNTETESSTIAESETETKISTVAESEPETESNTTVENESETETESNTTVETETETETESSTTVETKTESSTTVETETENSTTVETETETESSTTVETETETEIVTETETETDLAEAYDEYQYIAFKNNDKIKYGFSKDIEAELINKSEELLIYKVNTIDEVIVEASIGYAYRLEIPTELEKIIHEKNDRVLSKGIWKYSYIIQMPETPSTEEEPIILDLDVITEAVSVKVNGKANIEGLDDNSMAAIGSEVVIEVTEPGYVLTMTEKDENGKDVCVAMALDYDNKYSFIVKENMEFSVLDPDTAGYTILNSATSKAKLTGVAGIKLVSLKSSAQGYNEVVLNFEAVKNGSDGTNTENVYYEVKVTATPKEGETLPKGSSTSPKYYYFPKKANENTQSESIIVNDGITSSSTACTYEFSVKMVLINKKTKVPEEDKASSAAVSASLSGNTITKSFSTKNLYYEDKIGFNKKNTKVYAGQQDVLVGSVKYSKKASYIHDLTAVAYDSKGEEVYGITCSFKNDNDELYVSSEKWVAPGEYKVVVYAGIGEKETADSPQGGTMYQSNTSFKITILSSIRYIYATNVTKKAVVNNKNITFSAVPELCEDYYSKIKKPKLTYKIMSAIPDKTEYDGYRVVEPVEKVKNNISVNNKGKVTVKRGYYVDSDTSKNHIAIVIKAADYEGNDAYAIAYVEIVSNALVPTNIYLVDKNGYRLGNTVTADRAQYASVVVLDQYGCNMNEYVNITPTDNSKSTSKIYVTQSSYNGSATLYVRKPSTVTIKVKTKDGSNKSKSVKFNITVPSFSKGYYHLHSIYSNGFEVNSSDYDATDGYTWYRAQKNAVIKVRVGANIGGEAYYNNDWFEWKYRVTGGKYKMDGEYLIITQTEKKMKLEISSKVNPRYFGQIIFENLDWSTKYDAAPKLKQTEGKLYANRYGNDYYDYQYLSYEYDYGSYDGIQIARISKSAPYLYVSDFKPENRMFKLALYQSDVKPGSYKYKVAFYKNGTLMCNPATITVKINKASPVKINTSYNMDTSIGTVDLKCNPKEFLPDFDTKLLNANINGKANDFNKYFELAYVTDSVTKQKKAVIKFKSTVTAAQKNQLKGQTFTGYVKYSYYYGYSYIKNATSKIVIKVK